MGAAASCELSNDVSAHARTSSAIRMAPLALQEKTAGTPASYIYNIYIYICILLLTTAAKAAHFALRMSHLFIAIDRGFGLCAAAVKAPLAADEKFA